MLEIFTKSVRLKIVVDIADKDYPYSVFNIYREDCGYNSSDYSSVILYI